MVRLLARCSRNGTGTPRLRFAGYHPESRYRRPNLTLRRADVTPIWSQPGETSAIAFDGWGEGKLMQDGKRLEVSGRYLLAVILESCRGMEFGELNVTGAMSRKVRRRPFRILRALNRLAAPLSFDGPFDDPLGW